MFVFESTDDGSPTVRIQGTDGSLSEAMHSLKGAFSETVYIYGTAISTCLEKGFPPRVLSMGLGLGYVEVLAAALMLKGQVALPNAGGESFEIVPELREGFRGWLLGGTTSVLNDTYDEILRRTSATIGVPETAIRGYLGHLVQSGAWKISDALTPSTEFTQRYGCICFDAFSSKSTPDLWTEDFLKSFFASACEPSCVLSTYACTGALKRSLRESGFSLQIREGFSSKRDSTFAVREA